MDLVPNMGMHRDMIQRKSLARIDDAKRRNRTWSAREAIYLKNFAVDSTAVETLLKEDSLVPTAVSVLFVMWLVLCSLFQNAFSDKLSAFNFNIFDILVVDLLHEVELGVWKAVFIHLLRLLDCENENLKHELDRR
jgi:hypothetical protein